jgi:hypothetical protein
LVEHDTVFLIVQSPAADDLLDEDVLAWARDEGDPNVSLEEVRARLSKIKGSLAEAVIADRGEY